MLTGPPVLCVSVTAKHNDPPGGITSGSWLPLVFTVNGLVGFAVPDPKVIVHVVPATGMVARKPAQLAVTDAPAAMVTVLLAFPGPSTQLKMKDQTPAATVWAGRLVKPQVAVVPTASRQAVVRVPIDGSSVDAAHAGAVPLPWR